MYRTVRVKQHIPYIFRISCVCGRGCIKTEIVIARVKGIAAGRNRRIQALRPGIARLLITYPPGGYSLFHFPGCNTRKSNLKSENILQRGSFPTFFPALRKTAVEISSPCNCGNERLDKKSIPYGRNSLTRRRYRKVVAHFLLPAL